MISSAIPKDWKHTTLSSVIDLISGQHIQVSDCNTDGRGVPYLTGPSDFEKGEIRNTKFTEAPQVCCKAGDILLTVKGSGTGTTALAHKDYCISRQLMAVRPRNADSAFIRFVLEAHADTYNKVSAGLIPGIARGDVLNTRLGIPPLIEQQKIGQALQTWSEAIEKTEQLIASRVKQKAWLLTRAISASGQTTKLGVFLKQVSRPVPKPTEPYWALGIRSHGKGTFQRFVENPASVDMEELYAVNRDYLIVNITFAWEGAIASVKPEDERCLVSHRFPSYAVNREIADPGFVKYIVNRKAFFSQLAFISPGGAGRNRVLNKKDFLKLEVSLPSLSEQKRLAQVLGMMDLLIEKEILQLSALKIQKRGLMQKLLTGQWRVKLPETAAA